MGMKAKGVQFTDLARRLYIEIEGMILKGHQGSNKTTPSQLASARQIAASAAAQGCQSMREFKPKHRDKFNAERIAAGTGKGQLSKDQAIINKIFKKTGRPELARRKHPVEVRRTKAEREKPKVMTDSNVEARKAMQILIEAKSERYGIAANSSLEFGLRKTSAIMARYVLVKEEVTGKGGKKVIQYRSNWGTKNPATDMKVVNLRNIRNMYASDEERRLGNTPKDWAFEREHMGKMDIGEVNLYVGNDKNNVRHLVPIEHNSQFDQVRRINEFCIKEGTKSLAPKGKSLEQAGRQFGDILKEVGMTKKQEGITLHWDRHRYLQLSELPPEKLIRAAGHGDIRKLDSYRFKR